MKDHWSASAAAAFRWVGSKCNGIGTNLENAAGVGDIVATGTESTRVDKWVEWLATDVLGREGCGCPARRNRLNTLFPFGLPKLIIAIPEYNDRGGLWAMLQELCEEIKLSNLSVHVELLVVTQTPVIKAPVRVISNFGRPDQVEHQPGPTEVIAGPEDLAKQCEMITARGVKCHYREFASVIGTGPAKRACWDFMAKLGAEWGWVCDSHLHFAPGSVGRFYNWMRRTKNRNSKHLYHCPLLFDDGKSAFTHFETRAGGLPLIGQDNLWGQFRTEKKLLGTRSKPMEIQAHGGFWMASRVDIAVQTFGHALFKGFGDPETIIHEQRRAAGFKVYCLPSRIVSCWHRFLKIRHNDYHSPWTDALRNHVIGVEWLRVHLMKEAVLAGFREPVEWLLAGWMRTYPDRAAQIQQTAMDAIDEFCEWQAATRQKKIEDAARRKDAAAKKEANKKQQAAAKAVEEYQQAAEAAGIKPSQSDTTFDDIHANKSWGGGETVSGPGSTLDATEKLRTELARTIQSLGITSLLDAPCGDFNWMSRVEWASPIQYIGGDVVKAIVDGNRKKYPDRDFRVLDLRTSDLPACDAVFTRDCLVHLPYDEARQAIDNVIRSGAKYFLATHFPGRKNHDIPRGHWRPLDMTAEPFNLPAPVSVINEGCKEGDGAFDDKSIGVWLVADIAASREQRLDEVAA